MEITSSSYASMKISTVKLPMYAEIDEIILEEAKRIEGRIQAHQSTQQDRLRFNKFHFVNKYLKEDTDPKVKELLYNYYYSDPHRRDMFQNILVEHRIRQNDSTIEQQLQYEINENPYAELFESRAQKLLHLQKVLEFFGLNGSQDDRVLSNQQFIDGLQALFAQEDMIRDLWGKRDQSKDDSTIQDNQKAVNLLNIMLRQWGACQIKAIKNKKKVKKKFVPLPSSFQIQIIQTKGSDAPTLGQLIQAIKDIEHQDLEMEAKIPSNYLLEDCE